MLGTGSSRGGHSGGVGLEQISPCITPGFLRSPTGITTTQQSFRQSGSCLGQGSLSQLLWSRCDFDPWPLRYMNNIVEIRRLTKGIPLRRSERGRPVPLKAPSTATLPLCLAEVLKLLWEQHRQARQGHRPAGEGAGGRQVTPITSTMHRASWLHSTKQHKEIISEEFGIYQKYIFRQFDHSVRDLPFIKVVLLST